MIKLNNRNADWYEGMTVRGLLDDMDYVYSYIVVKIDGRLIEEKDWAVTEIPDGADVSAIHLMAGG